MNLYEKEAWKSFLGKWPWEWFVSLNLKADNYESALRQYAIQLQKEERLQVAYAGVYNGFGNHHLHLVMLGRNRKGMTLLRRNPAIWERRWSAMLKESCVIEEILSRRERKRVIGYILDENTPEHRHELLRPYNLKLLMKSKMH